MSNSMVYFCQRRVKFAPNDVASPRKKTMLENILDKIDLRQLGESLQKARIRQGLTPEDAARLLDVARTTITAIEKGERRIRASELMRLAEEYGRDLSDFVSNRPQIG